MSEFIFRIFMVPDEAQAYAASLHEVGIPAEIQTETGPLPDYILGGMAAPRFLLLVPESLLSDAEKNIADWMMKQVKQDPPSNHLFKNYSRGELEQVVSNPKEWSDYDLAYAKYLLSEG
jgi:hypothetical protein